MTIMYKIYEKKNNNNKYNDEVDESSEVFWWFSLRFVEKLYHIQYDCLEGSDAIRDELVILYSPLTRGISHTR